MAIGFAHPEHIACFEKMPASKYASEPPAGQLRIASNATLQFSKNLFQSAIDLLSGTMMSSGGDEVNLPCWNEDEPTIEDLAQSNTTIDQALNNFIHEVQGVMHANGKMPFIKSGSCTSSYFWIVLKVILNFADMVLTHNVPVLNNTAVVSVMSAFNTIHLADFHCLYSVWQTSADAVKVAQRGLRFIHQPSNYFYLVSPLH